MEKILVVEDEIITADYLCDILKFHHYEVLEPAINYTEAVAQIDEHQPDLCILDIRLSGQKSGIDVAHYLNEHSEIPFLYLTSYGDTKTLELVKQTYPLDFLTKPFKREDIAPIIEIVLSNKKNLDKKDNQASNKEIISQWQQLTDSERKVIGKISENKTSKEIAEELFVSLSTIKTHRHNICQKLSLPMSNNSLMNWVLMNKSSLK
jgi:DNA-binding NarL/FixJ family response regulator